MPRTDHERPHAAHRRRRNDAHDTSPAAIRVHLGSPHVRAQVNPAERPTGRRSTDHFVTSFNVVWQPAPVPPSQWVDLLRAAPFGSGTVRASNLHWDGKYLSIELTSEAEIEAYAVQIPEWEDYANTAYARLMNPPAAQVVREAQRRAREIEERLRR